MSLSLLCRVGGTHQTHNMSHVPVLLLQAGTLQYMAPELLMRSAPASPASDVYAFAVMLNEMATGVVPFSDCTKVGVGMTHMMRGHAREMRCAVHTCVYVCMDGHMRTYHAHTCCCADVHTARIYQVLWQCAR